jgi:hypothetical protein
LVFNSLDAQNKTSPQAPALKAAIQTILIKASLLTVEFYLSSIRRVFPTARAALSSVCNVAEVLAGSSKRSNAEQLVSMALDHQLDHDRHSLRPSMAKSDDKIRIRFSIQRRRWLLTGMERSGVPVYACFASLLGRKSLEQRRSSCRGAKTGHSFYRNEHQYPTSNWTYTALNNMVIRRVFNSDKLLSG